MTTHGAELKVPYLAKYIYRIALPVNHIDIDQQYTGGISKITAHWPKIEKIKLKLPRK